jgi:transcriptional regulator with XRE-family HTH domain
MSTNDQLLSDFIDAWNAGHRPRVRDYLARLPDGPERDDLAGQITSWLEIAPTPAHDEETRSQIRSEPIVARVLESDAALVPALRARAGLSVGELAARLVERLSLDRADTSRAAGYLARLERGALDPSRISRRLLDALGALLGVPGDALARPRPAAGAIFRAESDAADRVRDDIELLSRAALSPAPPPMDELDRLFMGGPEA